MTMQELAIELDVMIPDMEALQEVIEVHKKLDPPDEPLVLSMSILPIWGMENATL